MVKIAMHSERHWHLAHQAYRVRAEQAPSASEHIKVARLAIIAAKMAYRMESDRWLCLLSKAVSAIEACPESMQKTLNSELLCVSTCDVYRPR